MQRRTLLKLGAVSAGVMALLGGVVATLPAGLDGRKLAAPGREVFLALGRAMLEGSLPAGAAEREAALAGLLRRLDDLIGALPPAMRGELADLLSLLHSGAGRRLLAGLSEPWAQAPSAAVAAALQSMRFSSLELRRQAYQALHDLVGGAYFSDPATWRQLGYPGPNDI